MYTKENTAVYTQDELDTLNTEWARIVAAEGLEPETDEYYQREKQFQDSASQLRRENEIPLARIIDAHMGYIEYEIGQYKYPESVEVGCWVIDPPNRDATVQNLIRKLKNLAYILESQTITHK